MLQPLVLLFFLQLIFFQAYSITHVVKVVNYKFDPVSLTINEGDEVIWINESDMQHTSTSGMACAPNGQWNSGNIDPGQKFNYLFTKAGSFSYFCVPHCSQGMTGNITVQPGKESLNNREVHKSIHETSVLHTATSLEAVAKMNTPGAKIQKYVITMVNYKFEPSAIQVNPGDTVVWLNTTDMTHTSTSGLNCTSDGNWNSGNVEPGKQFMHVFLNKGDFPYYCVPHCFSDMKGIVHVGQTSALVNPDDEKKRLNKERTRFPATDVISNPSVTTLPKGYLEFRILHRFDDIAGKVGNSHNLYGLDNIREVRLGFAYGITNRLMIGIGRNEGDQFQAPYQEVSEIYDGFIKYRLLKQKNEPDGKAPFSLSFFANTAFSRRHTSGNVFSEAYFPNFGDRFSYCAQILAAYNLGTKLSLQVMPTYLKRNWVNPWRSGQKDEVNLFSIGGAARWNFTKHFAVLSEYFYVFSNYRSSNRSIFSNPLAVGVEFYTGKHIFHINLSNSTGVIPNTFIPYTTSSWRKGEFRLGFSITRLFNVGKKKQPKSPK
jgi:plastocyanin